MKLRCYQEEAKSRVLSRWDDVHNTLLVLPTGTGKTVTFSDIIKDRMNEGSAMILAHREELIWQAADKVHKVTGIVPEIEMAEHEASPLVWGKRIVVSTVQTQTSGLPKRYNKFDPMDFATIVIDEAHHAISKSYREVVAHYRKNPRCKILGVTATPDRGDGKGLGRVFEDCAYSYDLREATHDGWLVPIRQTIVDVDGLDFSGIKKAAGDFNGRQLSEVMTYERNLHGVASPTIELIKDRPTIVFTSSVAHAERLSEIFNRHRRGMSEWVCGKTDRPSRRATLGRFMSGETQVICNVGVLVEGFDAPHAACVVVAKPTGSRSRYAQMVGRGTRPLPQTVDLHPTADGRVWAIAQSAKPDCLVIDFAGNAGRHKLISAVDLIGTDLDPEVAERTRQISRGNPEEPLEEIIERAEEEIEAERKEAERKAAEWVEKRKAIRAKATYKTRGVDPFTLTNIARPSASEPSLPSPKHMELLEKNGIDHRGMDGREAGALCKEIVRRHKIGQCTIKQAQLLNRYHLPTKIGKRTAGALIDAIAGNGWKLPNDKVVGEICPQAVGRLKKY